MKILFVSNRLSVFKVDSGGANRNNMLVKALARLGHVDVASFYQEEVNETVANCDVAYSHHIDDYHGYLESARALLSFILFPKNPYSYYRKHKKKEAIIDNLVEKNKYDLIVCRYVDDTIKCGLLKYASKLVIDVDDNPAGVLRYQTSTPIGARGYDGICEEGVHYMQADDDEEFARKTIELLESVEKARRMARKGRELAIRNFSQEKFFEIVELQLTERIPPK